MVSTQVWSMSIAGRPVDVDPQDTLSMALFISHSTLTGIFLITYLGVSDYLSSWLLDLLEVWHLSSLPTITSWTKSISALSINDYRGIQYLWNDRGLDHQARLNISEIGERCDDALAMLRLTRDDWYSYVVYIMCRRLLTLNIFVTSRYRCYPLGSGSLSDCLPTQRVKFESQLSQRHRKLSYTT